MESILIVAGEVSGDSHAAAMVAEFKKLEPAVQFWGIGGDELKTEGTELLYHLQDMAFLGVSEVIKHLPFILQVQREILSEAEKRQPLCAVLIDYPGFNLKMARRLKKLGIAVVYYISPQLWAWGGWRVKKIRKYVDKMLVLFEFEKKFYEQYGINAEFVGHPLVDKFKDVLPISFKPFEEENIVIGLLPGSRKQEIGSLLPDMITAAEILYKEGEIQSAEIVKVEHLPHDLYKKEIGNKSDYIKIVQEPLQQCLPRYDAVLIASGTATLETGYFGVPMVVVYKVQLLTYWLGRLLIRLKNIALINIVAGKELVPELIQNEFTPPKAAALIKQYLSKKGNSEKREQLKLIRDKLGKGNVSERAASYLKKFIRSAE